MNVYKTSFLPVIVRNDDGSTSNGGRYMVYVTAENPFRVGDVLKAFLPELYDEGYTVEEMIEVPVGSRIWSVSVGPDGRSYSLLVRARDEEHALQGLMIAVEDMPVLKNYVSMGLFKTRHIDLSKEGVW